MRNPIIIFTILALSAIQIHAQSVSDLAKILEAQFRARVGTEFRWECTLDSPTYVKAPGEAPVAVQTIRSSMKSLTEWSFSVDAGGFLCQYIADGSGKLARIDEGGRSITVKPIEDELRSLLNADCLFLALEAMRKPSPDWKLSTLGKKIIATGPDSKYPYEVEFEMDSQTFAPLKYTAWVAGSNRTRLIETVEQKPDGVWAKVMYLNDGSIMQKQDWKFLGKSVTPDKNQRYDFGRKLKPGYFLYIDTPDLKMNGEASDAFAGMPLSSVLQAKPKN